MISTPHAPAHERSDSIAASSPFGRLIRSLTQLDFQTVEASVVESILNDAAIDEASLAPFVNFVPHRYSRNGVYRDDRFELIVMCWPAGVKSAIHEHGGSRGFVRILRESVCAENYSIVECDRAAGYARLASAETRQLHTGEIEIVVPGQDVHRVGAAGPDAVSLHLYAKPLDRFFIFDDAQRSCREVAGVYDLAPATSLPR